jgi:hypothetical protein
MEGCHLLAKGNGRLGNSRKIPENYILPED